MYIMYVKRPLGGEYKHVLDTVAEEDDTTLEFDTGTVKSIDIDQAGPEEPVFVDVNDDLRWVVMFTLDELKQIAHELRERGYEI